MRLLFNRSHKHEPCNHHLWDIGLRGRSLWGCETLVVAWLLPLPDQGRSAPLQYLPHSQINKHHEEDCQQERKSWKHTRHRLHYYNRCSMLPRFLHRIHWFPGRNCSLRRRYDHLEESSICKVSRQQLSLVHPLHRLYSFDPNLLAICHQHQ